MEGRNDWAKTWNHKHEQKKCGRKKDSHRKERGQDRRNPTKQMFGLKTVTSQEKSYVGG